MPHSKSEWDFLQPKTGSAAYGKAGSPLRCREDWYNRKRIHSAIEYMTPQQRETAKREKVA